MVDETVSNKNSVSGDYRKFVIELMRTRHNGAWWRPGLYSFSSISLPIFDTGGITFFSIGSISEIFRWGRRFWWQRVGRNSIAGKCEQSRNSAPVQWRVGDLRKKGERHVFSKRFFEILIYFPQRYSVLFLCSRNHCHSLHFQLRTSSEVTHCLSCWRLVVWGQQYYRRSDYSVVMFHNIAVSNLYYYSSKYHRNLPSVKPELSNKCGATTVSLWNIGNNVLDECAFARVAPVCLRR